MSRDITKEVKETRVITGQVMGRLSVHTVKLGELHMGPSSETLPTPVKTKQVETRGHFYSLLYAIYYLQSTT